MQRKLLVVQPRGVDENEGKADEEELLKNLAALETRGKVTSDMDEGGSSSTNVPKADEDEAPERPEKPVIFVMPHPRFNAPLTVQDDVLYIFGGTFEKADREFTFDELWAIDLGKLDGVKEIFKRELEDWQGSEDDEGSEDEEEDDDVEDSEDDAEDGEMSETASTAATSVSNTPMSPTKGLEADSVQENGDTGFAEEVSSSLEDALPHPRPFESLRDFYARTSVQWQEAIVAELSTASATGGKTVKEVRKSAFGRAEEKWWDCREEVRNLEDEQLEAGIGEVVSLADKGGEAGGGGPGRRR